MASTAEQIAILTEVYPTGGVAAVQARMPGMSAIDRARGDVSRKHFTEEQLVALKAELATSSLEDAARSLFPERSVASVANAAYRRGMIPYATFMPYDGATQRKQRQKSRASPSANDPE